MRKSLSAILAFLCITGVCAACQTSPASTGTPESSHADAAVGSDYRVSPPNPVVLSGQKTESYYCTMDTSKVYHTIPQLTEDATGIVQATIENVSYFFVDKTPYTLMDVQITDVLSGSLQSGDRISIFKEGGYILLENYMPDIQERFPEITDEEMRSTLADVRVEGDPHPVNGQNAVFFLRQPNPAFPEMDGMYGIVDGYGGQFTENASGSFLRHIEHLPESNQAGDTAAYSLENVLEYDRSQAVGADRSFTAAELKAEILEAV
ncbi:MAG: hypothetical protein HFE86_02635 [Clostridiales bacterium]|nr:hypothetical protein [Clostridiales bacterium]